MAAAILSSFCHGTLASYYHPKSNIRERTYVPEASVLLVPSKSNKCSAKQPFRSISTQGTRSNSRLKIFSVQRRKISVKAAQAVDLEPRVDEGLVERCVNTIRMLTVDSVNNAKAGHPGAAMGLAPIGYILWDEAMRFNPQNPHWFNRDRFVMSLGHGVLLQYVLLHLTGFDLQIEDLKSLAQFGSRTPGHPENLITPGVEVVTGPLGQGFANSVGLALAEKHLASRFNKPDITLVDHYTFVIMGDGCAMEGVTNEAASLAGHWGLGKLIAFYDDNKNTIDGSTSLAFSEDVGGRYKALGWHVQTITLEQYGNPDVLRKAVTAAKVESSKPSLIVVETVIGYGSPSKEGTHNAHHGAFGDEEAQKIREHLNWKHQEPFYVPEDVYREMRKQTERGQAAEAEWRHTLEDYDKRYPNEAQEFRKCMAKELPSGWEDALPKWKPDDKPDATRGYSETALNALAEVFPGLIGGSADLASSNKVYLHNSPDFQSSTPHGRNIRYGVREHGMGAISNGIALHNSGLIPFAATFLVFTDYMRAAVRLSALSHANVLWITTHDSIGLGEDGPTHQPVEHLASLRAMPNINVFRPGDGNEVSAGYIAALRKKDGPTLLALSRQKLDAHLEGSSIEGALKGGYVLTDNSSDGLPELILIGTGSELILCQKAALQLREEGLKVRVVSLVCWELFEQQDEAYRQSVLPPPVTARLSVEAGSPQGWREWTGPKGQMLAVSRFGASGPYLAVFEAFGFTVDNVIKTAKDVVASQ